MAKKQFYGNIYDTYTNIETFLKEPLFDYNFVVALPSITSVKYGNYAEIVGNRCTSVNIPFRTFNAEEIQTANEKRFYAGLSEISNLDMEFYEDTNMITTIYFLAWQSKIRQLYKGKSYNAIPSNYKRNIEVYIIDNAGYLNAKFNLIGAFPTSVEPIQLGNEGQNISIRVSIPIDDVKMKGLDSLIGDTDYS